MKNTFLAIIACINDTSELIYGKRWRYVSLIADIVGIILAIAFVIVWIKFGFIAMLKVYGILAIVLLPVYAPFWYKGHKWMKALKNGGN